MSTVTDRQVFQGRWGFYPFSRETDRKLRFLNKMIQKALQQHAKWNRWNNKLPHNRVLKQWIRRGNNYHLDLVRDDNGNPVSWPEPDICFVFIEKSHPTRAVYRNGKWTKETVENAWEISLNEHLLTKIRVAADLSRQPKAEASQVVFPKMTVEEIDHLYNILS
jgi:hypothetical protein